MRVYKFLSAHFALKSLYERRLKISRIDDLNDPYDLLPFSISTPQQEKAMRVAVAGISKNNGLLCFSSDWSDPVIWAHYADKHYGICLGFDIPDNKCRKVEYVNEKMPFPNRPDQATAEKWLFVKFASWQYEHEIRVAARLDESEDGLFYMNFDNTLQLAEVILGARCTQPKVAIDRALGDLRNAVTIKKARADHGDFRIVEDEEFK